MNYKLLMGLEQEENKVLRSKISQLKTEIAALQTEKEKEQMMKASAESELEFIQDSMMHMNNRIVGYTRDCGTVLDIKA